MATTTCELLRVNVERGPNWLFLRLQPSRDKNYDTLADQIWAVLACHFIYRVVIELDQFKTLTPTMIEQLAELQSRIADRGGWLRLSGTSDAAQHALDVAGLGEVFRSHHSRSAAVAGISEIESPHFELTGEFVGATAHK